MGTCASLTRSASSVAPDEVGAQRMRIDLAATQHNVSNETRESQLMLLARTEPGGLVSSAVGATTIT
eukprot:28044-Pleurochrysis_carterae.AAC.1